jgi:hypothetical protein
MAREMSCLATVDVVRQCSSLPWNGSWPAVERRAGDQRHLHGHRNHHLRGANVRLSAVWGSASDQPLSPRNKLEESTHRWPLSSPECEQHKRNSLLPSWTESLWKWTDSIHRVQHTGAITESIEPTTNHPGTNLCLQSFVCPLLKLVGPLCCRPVSNASAKGQTSKEYFNSKLWRHCVHTRTRRLGQPSSAGVTVQADIAISIHLMSAGTKATCTRSIIKG